MRRSEANLRAARIEVLYGREVPLVVRARFERTFWGLVTFAGLILLLGGRYLMIEALLDPLGASDMAVLTAGLALALSSFLLVLSSMAAEEDGTGAA